MLASMRSHIGALGLPLLALAIQSSPAAGAQVVDTFTVGVSDPVGDMAWDGSTMWMCDRSSAIERRDPSTGHIVQGFRLELPHVTDFGLEWDGTQLWVSALDGSASLYRLNPLDGSILGSMYLRNDPTGGGGIFALARKGDQLWALLGFGPQSYIARIDPQTGEVSEAQLRREPSLFGLAWDGSAFVTCSYSAQMLYRIDPQNGRVLSAFPSPSGGSPTGLGWDGRYLWVTSYPHLYKMDLDAQACEPLRIALIQRGPRHAGRGKDLDWDDGGLWYTEVYDAGVYLLDSSWPSSVIRHLQLAFSPTGIKRLGPSLWTTYNHIFGGNLIELDLDSGAMRRVLPFRQGMHPLGMDFDGQDLLVVGGSSRPSRADSIYRVSPLDGAIVGGIPSPGTGAAGVAWDGQSLWETDWVSDRLYELDPESGEVRSKYELPIGTAGGISFDPRNHSFWLTDDSDRIYEVLLPTGTTHLLEFTATAEDSDVVVRWKPTRASRQQEFVLERGDRAEGPYREIARLAAAGEAYETRDRGLSAGLIYYYRLQALGASGAKILGPLSVAFHFTYPPLRTPIVAQDLRAAPSLEGIRIEWSLDEAALQCLASIDVERAPAATGPFTRVTAGSLPPERAMSCEDREVVPGSPVWYRLVLRSKDGTRAYVGPVRSTPGSRRDGIRLDPPIASVRGVDIHFGITGPPTRVQLAIYDGRGRRVRVLENALRGPGEHQATWNCRDTAGCAVARGLYFVRLEAAGRTAVRKWALLHR